MGAMECYNDLTVREIVEKIAELQEQLGPYSQQEQELRVVLKKLIRKTGRENSKDGWVETRCERPKCPYREVRRVDRRTMGRSNRVHTNGDE